MILGMKFMPKFMNSRNSCWMIQKKNVFLLPYCALLVWDEITDRPEPNSGDVSVWLFLILDAKEKSQWASLTYAFDEWSVWG